MKVRSSRFLTAIGENYPGCPIYQECPLSIACDALNTSGYSPIYKIHLDKNTILFRNEIDYGCIYVVVSGIAAVYTHLDAGEMMVFGLVGKGFTLGETEYFTKEKSVYSIKTLTPCVFCRLPVEDLDSIIDARPFLMKRFIQASNKCMQMFSRQIWVMNAQLVYDRLKRLLCVLAKLQAKQGENFVRINISHEELALLINTTRVSVTRMLNIMEQEGNVRLKYNEIEIVGPLFEFSEKADTDIFTPAVIETMTFAQAEK